MEAIAAVVASVVGQRDRGGDGGRGERKGKSCSAAGLENSSANSDCGGSKGDSSRCCATRTNQTYLTYDHNLLAQVKQRDGQQRNQTRAPFN